VRRWAGATKVGGCGLAHLKGIEADGTQLIYTSITDADWSTSRTARGDDPVPRGTGGPTPGCRNLRASRVEGAHPGRDAVTDAGWRTSRTSGG